MLNFATVFFAYQASGRALESKITLKTKRICSLMRAKKTASDKILLLFVSVKDSPGCACTLGCIMFAQDKKQLETKNL